MPAGINIIPSERRIQFSGSSIYGMDITGENYGLNFHTGSRSILKINKNYSLELTGSLQLTGSLYINGINNTRTYKAYTATFTQEAEFDPVVNVLENTLGVELTWSRQSTGIFNITASDPVFTPTKTFTLVNVQGVDGVTMRHALVTQSTDTEIYLNTLDRTEALADNLGAAAGNLLCSMEIRVYQ